MIRDTMRAAMAAASLPDPTATTPGRTSANLDAPTIGLSVRAASLLAYSAGWVSGALVLALEGRRLEVRRHAAQAFMGFGLLTVVSVVLLALAGISLFLSIGLFRGLIWAVQGVIVIGIASWIVALVQTARGKDWRWPLLADRADRVARGDKRR